MQFGLFRGADTGQIGIQRGDETAVRDLRPAQPSKRFKSGLTLHQPKFTSVPPAAEAFEMAQNLCRAFGSENIRAAYTGHRP